MRRRARAPAALVLSTAVWFGAGIGSALAEDAVVVFEPRRRAVLASQVMSRIAEALREEGDPIESGEVLFRLDPTMFQANRDKADARRATAQANLDALGARSQVDLEESELARASAVLEGARQRVAAKERLFADNTLAAADVEEARTLEAVARADVEIAQKRLSIHKIDLAREIETAQATLRLEEANLLSAERELAECTVLVPFGGRVARLLRHAHESVQPGQELAEVVDDRVLLARFFAPSRSLPRIRMGGRLEIRIEETGGVVEGVVRQIGALVEPASSTIQVSLEVDNAGRSLRGGMRGTLSLADLVREGDSDR